MSKRDEYLDEELQSKLRELDIPPPDDAAKKRAIAMAREEFESVQRAQSTGEEQASQGIFQWLRLIVGKHADNRRAIMPFNQKLIYSGITAAALGAIAVGITLQYQNYPEAPGRQSADDMARSELEVAAASADGERDEREAKPAAKIRIAGKAAQPRQISKQIELFSLHPEPAAEEAFGDFSAPSPTVGFAARSDMAPGITAKRAAGPADADLPQQPYYQDEGRDRFGEFEQNRVRLVAEEPVSTFSADVDTASYSFVRRMLNSGVLPQSDAVRAEELINYFDYAYPLPESRQLPFKPTVAVTASPWAEGRKLMHIGIKGYDLDPASKPRTNLVFLLDVSGSMNSPDKLPLVKQSLELLLTTLNPDDTVAIAVYAGAAGVVLEPTPVKDKQKILDAMRQLRAGGSTAGAQGIRLAYELADSQFEENAINRVILATDGDFNVGITNQRELQSFIERKREQGVFLSVLGFGQGNYQDALMQTLAQNGNGIAAYIDTLGEAQKVLVEEASSTLFPIARDVKLQVEFNPAMVAEYRLIGYETRHLNREDFRNDAVDAGDIGAGHSVTAIYEFTPVGSASLQIEQSRYAPKAPDMAERNSEYAFVKIRYKLPGEDSSRLITQPVSRDHAIEPGQQGTAGEVGFATAVAGFAQILKGGRYTGEYSYDDVIELALRTRGNDPYGYRTEFVQLARKAKSAAAMKTR